MHYPAFGFAPGSIWIVDADGKHRRQVTTEEHLNTSPAWAPDGRALLFVSDRDGTRDIYRQRIDAGGEPQDVAERLTTGAEVYNVTMSRDGSRIAYSTVRQGNHIWMAPISDAITPLNLARPVTSEAQKTEGVAISHDGKWIAFDSDRDGPRQHLFKMAFDGTRAVGDPIQLTRGAHDEFSPRWSPDDSEIVFHRIVGGYRDVFVVGSDGRGEQRVTDDTSQYYDPDWSPDGRQIVLSSHRAKEKVQRKGFEAVIVTRNRDGVWSGRRAVNDATTPAGAVIRWSPKGEQLLMSGLRLLPVEGGAARPIGDPKRREARGDVVVWGADARTVYVWGPDSARIKTIWSVDLSTGKSRRLIRFDDPLRQPFGNRFDTDGKRLFFIMQSDEADVFSAELTRGAATRKP
jgi:dipeptidyl aminopeptidase/acylaminoacyl peptidase